MRHGRTRETLATLRSLKLPTEARLRAREGGNATMKTEWRDPADTTPGAARTARTVQGFRQFDPLRRCRKQHGDRCGIREEHIVAADLLRAWGDGAAIGFSAPRDLDQPVTAILYRPSGGPSAKARHQTWCWRRFVKVMAIFTREQRELLTFVVLMNHSVSALVKERHAEGVTANPSKVMAALVSCLDQLVQYLDTEVRDVIDRGVQAV